MTRLLSAVLISVLTLAPALAQQIEKPATLGLELNALQVSEGGCRVSFLATNDLSAALDRAAIEMAIFARDGSIDRIVTLDFKALSQGKTKVLQFELADLSCTDISRILINDITACQGPGIAASACLESLVTSSRPDIDFGV